MRCKFVVVFLFECILTLEYLTFLIRQFICLWMRNSFFYEFNVFFSFFNWIECVFSSEFSHFPIFPHTRFKILMIENEIANYHPNVNVRSRLHYCIEWIFQHFAFCGFSANKWLKQMHLSGFIASISKLKRTSCAIQSKYLQTKVVSVWLILCVFI